MSQRKLHHGRGRLLRLHGRHALAAPLNLQPGREDFHRDLHARRWLRDLVADTLGLSPEEAHRLHEGREVRGHRIAADLGAEHDPESR